MKKAKHFFSSSSSLVWGIRYEAQFWRKQTDLTDRLTDVDLLFIFEFLNVIFFYNLSTSLEKMLMMKLCTFLDFVKCGFCYIYFQLACINKNVLPSETFTLRTSTFTCDMTRWLRNASETFFFVCEYEIFFYLASCVSCFIRQLTLLTSTIFIQSRSRVHAR